MFDILGLRPRSSICFPYLSIPGPPGPRLLITSRNAPVRAVSFVECSLFYRPTLPPSLAPCHRGIFHVFLLGQVGVHNFVYVTAFCFVSPNSLRALQTRGAQTVTVWLFTRGVTYTHLQIQTAYGEQKTPVLCWWLLLLPKYWALSLRNTIHTQIALEYSSTLYNYSYFRS